MKLFDKFLKFLKTDRNTFLTYILTLITVYLVIDRIVEILFLFFTGMSTSYWGPIKYTLALACPVFAFLFSGSSKFTTHEEVKLSFFYLYCISLYIIGISMVVVWINQFAWLLFMWVPNYASIVTNFADLVKPAFTSLAIYIPLTTFYPLFKWLFTKVNDTQLLRESIFDYGGIDLSDNSEYVGPYTCEMALCKDKDTGKTIKTPENKRFETTLIMGGSGTGKTSTMFEPMIARDIERKYFFREEAKEMGYTALKTGIATLNCPYDNDYINKHFNLNMLTPNQYKEKVYKAYMKKLIYNSSGSSIIYKNLGITSMSPDFESTQHMLDVAENYNIPVELIDPSDLKSIGLNPFIYDNPSKTAIIISSVLKGMRNSNYGDSEEIYRENVATQAVENLTMILKELYPRLHEGLLPNLEDLLNLLNDFDAVEEMCEIIRNDEELSKKYNLQLGYFKRNFYKNSNSRAETEKYVSSVINQLDNLLRYPGVRNILCNRSNNLDYDEVLKEGKLVFVCTRRGELGVSTHKAFGLFFLLLMQHSVLTRPGNEKNRIPHFLYIDEFWDYICRATEPIFNLYRKYRVGTIISAQNLSQLDGNDKKSNFRQTIISNTATEIVFGNNTPEDNNWWEERFGDKREWSFSSSYDTSKGEYDSKLSSIKWGWTRNFKAPKILSLKFKACIYKTKNFKGKPVVGEGKVDFLETKYKEKHGSKNYNFAKFTPGVATNDDDKKPKSPKFNPKIARNNFYTDDHDIDPIQTDITDSSHFFDNDDAISFSFGKKSE